MQVPHRLEALPTMWSGWLDPRRRSYAPPYRSRLDIWVSLFFKIQRLDSHHSCSPTLCQSSPKAHELCSLHWSCYTSSCRWSIRCMSLSSNASPLRSVHQSCLVFHLRIAPTTRDLLPPTCPSSSTSILSSWEPVSLNMPPNGSSIYFLIRGLQLRSDTILWRIVLDHNRVQPLMEDLNGNKELIDFTYARVDDTGCLRGKPRLGKNHESP